MIPISRNQFGPCYSKRFFKGLFHPRHEIGHRWLGGRLGGRKRPYNSLALGDLDGFPVLEQSLNLWEMIAQIPNGDRLHVIHFSITSRPF